MKTKEALPSTSNRRAFLKGVGMTGIGLAGATMIGTRLAATGQPVEAAAFSDTDLLNFALNLEYLEAEFYAVSTFGATLVTLGVISSADETGPTMGGARIAHFGTQGTLATALREDEIAHVKLLRNALGTRAAKKPAINLNAAGYGFGSVGTWLKLARQFEDVGVSAYLGATPLVTSAFLAAAAAIIATEAQHSGAVRAACYSMGIVSPAVDGMDIPPSAAHPFNVDSTNALGIARTPAQVLNIAYLGGRCAGGFFPNGMNGTIVCQS